ncbi:DUF305 domain-containing protein [Pseudonocardia pini]|uniref:DUF305 domain-containing protein n=1 Tax=Pseudonocardia pini TaxID=2758030 RepID=UPI0028B08967|nr:DUF305 domain-containing protein [Pseudonocardia pini]
MTITDTDPEAAPARDEPRWVRPLVVIGAVVALLLLGGAGGLLLGMRDSPAATSTPATDSVDVEFAQDMTVHHQQAVEMAAWARDHTTDQDIRTLAFDIESTQNTQIGRMQGWLALWNASPFPVGRPYMTWMQGEGHSMGAMTGAAGANRMPGMASTEELAALRAAQGSTLDVLFLQLMLRHHQGGTDMLSAAADTASVPDVRNLAAQMLAAQGSESQLMTDMLAQRGAQPLPMN